MPQDNCPDVSNPGQANWDNEVEGDACDANDALVDNLRFRARDVLIWAAEGGSATYNVYRGSFGSSSSFVAANCMDVASSTTATDQADPGLGYGFFYLVTSMIQGVEQSPGWTSQGVPRTVSGSCSQ